jgi:hypothetical protein
MASKCSIEQCSVGKHVDSPFFLSRYVKENFDLHPLDNLDEDTRLTLQFRTNLNPISYVIIIKQHIQTVSIFSNKAKNVTILSIRT